MPEIHPVNGLVCLHTDTEYYEIVAKIIVILKFIRLSYIIYAHKYLRL
jgi:hypothetical protein